MVEVQSSHKISASVSGTVRFWGLGTGEGKNQHTMGLIIDLMLSSSSDLSDVSPVKVAGDDLSAEAFGVTLVRLRGPHIFTLRLPVVQKAGRG